jgi:hypothetical protein
MNTASNNKHGKSSSEKRLFSTPATPWQFTNVSHH